LNSAWNDLDAMPLARGVRRLQGLSDALSDDEVAELAFHQRRAQNGSDFLPLYLQRVVAISCVLRAGESWKVWTIGNPDDPERELIQRFFDGVDKFTPQLVSWNGQGFDAQVLHYRGLIHGVTAERYWDQGEEDRDFKWNNYISRYHPRHLDLMDLLALYQPRASAPLDALAKLIGFPGKMGMDGSAVWGAYREGRIAEIRNYCETDVVNTWLVYLRFQKMRGALSAEAYAREEALVRETLTAMPQAHWREYLAAWPKAL
jgi:predicted PolB exonuclease-like 3'-5' exonuclease